MSRPRLVERNEFHPDVNRESAVTTSRALHRPSASTEARSLLGRFDPRLVGFGIVGPRSNCLERTTGLRGSVLPDDKAEVEYPEEWE
jgi:hypothetical protein